MLKYILSVGFFFIHSVFIFGYNLKQLSNKEGLSNSAVLSICQDHDRFMWFGSCDGLNMYNGISIEVYKPTSANMNSLSGNLIEKVIECDSGILWVVTNHGLNRLNKKNRSIEYFNAYLGDYFCAKSVDNNFFVLYNDQEIGFYDRVKKSFVNLPFRGIIRDQVFDFFVDSKNVMWVVMKDGELLNATLSLDSGGSLLSMNKGIKLSPLRYCFHEGDEMYYIDADYNLYERNMVSKKTIFIKNIQTEVKQNGIVSAIIKDNDDFLVAFKTNGLIRLKAEEEYAIERIDIHCGVFSLCKDKFQDIIWIGTDGQGVYMYSRNSFSMRSVNYSNLPYHIQKPARALFLDDQKSLWVGTKDDGILKIDDYQPNKDISTKKITHLTTSNSLLANNSVFAFAPSRRGILWIGGDGPGLNYYSYADKKICTVPFLEKEQSNPILYVHSICEVSDSVLWVATVGVGVLKVVLTGPKGHPLIRNVTQYLLNKKDFSSNFFFTACQENDSILWFGNRGYGAARLNIKTEKFKTISFHKKNIETINDIWCIHKDQNGTIWFGSSYGLLRLVSSTNDSTSFENFNEIEGLPNNTIHGILEDNKNKLWLSTNNGIVEFDPKTKDSKVYNSRNGLNVIEFSDGAFFNDKKMGLLFFGGNNGFVTIAPDVFEEKKITPEISFTGIKIDEDERNLSDFMKEDKKGKYIELKYDQNYFSISFVALDYIDGQNYNYSYNLEHFNDKWINKGHSNTVVFTNISHGDYILHVRYKNGNTSFQQNVYSIRIRILPPWYLSSYAYLFYFVLGSFVLFVVISSIKKRAKRKRATMIEKLTQKQQEEIYESKLSFFTSITHEFCTPLTLIYGPCDRILTYIGSDMFVKKYANLILKNAEKLNLLIQELIEFRRIETGNKTIEVERFQVSEFIRNITDSFVDLAENKSINYWVDIESNLVWNSDKNCLSKIVTNLLSNAFKYTPEDGKIRVNIFLENDCLKILISNTGKGINELDIPHIFDRYRVLENFEKQTQQGLSSRNGLGLAICHNMVNLLGGQIDVKSMPNVLTEFRVNLPLLDVNSVPNEHIAAEENVLPRLDSTPLVIKGNTWVLDRTKATILVVDNEIEMLWFISEIFMEGGYNVIPVQDPRTVLHELKQTEPDLIISDVMMPSLDGISLTRILKTNPKTAHIPLILLSAKKTKEEQLVGIEAGAEIYITKPFDVEYIKSIAERLIQRQNELKNYYSSPLPTFEFLGGKLIHKDDKALFEKVVGVIQKNMLNSGFSSEVLASEMGLSSRHLYRKLKQISGYTPVDMIKECRFGLVEKLLLSTQLSIDEIMYKAGFSNRANFFRLFSKRYGMTPQNYRIQKNTELTKPIIND